MARAAGHNFGRTSLLVSDRVSVFGAQLHLGFFGAQGRDVWVLTFAPITRPKGILFTDRPHRQNGQQTSPVWNNWVNPSFTGGIMPIQGLSTATTATLIITGSFLRKHQRQTVYLAPTSGQYTATPSGGYAPFTYQWRVRQGPNQSNLGAGRRGTAPEAPITRTCR